MQIESRGILSPAVAGTDRSALTFPCVRALASGALLAAVRAGSTKDSADERIELYRSDDSGHSWQLQQQLRFTGSINGAYGSLKLCYLTETAPRKLLAAAMWVDRSSYPGEPLFNPATEGCLPMTILLAESADDGATWTPWRLVPLPDEIGPASLTSPIIQLPDGTLVMSIESNKAYHDSSPWRQYVALFHSHDGGASWGPQLIAGRDPSGRIFNWDQRLGLSPDGRLGAFLWTYDHETQQYLNIHRRISADGGLHWSDAIDLGIADQPGRPAVLPDGRVVLPWVDRFGTQTIRACLLTAIDGTIIPDSDTELYALKQPPTDQTQANSTGAALAEQGLWTFGLPFAEYLPDGSVLVVYYAGDQSAMAIHWVRLEIS